MKNILFISDAFLGGGLETRIVEQIKILKNHKIRAFLLCRELNNLYAKNFTTASDALTLEPSGQTLTSQSILNDVDTICNFCMENNIDFIDCNPFWCTLPAALAASRLNIPISFTLHGVTSANFIAKEKLTAQIVYDVIFSYGFSQIFAVAEYLNRTYSYLPNIIIVRNGIPINHLSPKSFKNTKKVAIASRLDKPKTKLIIDFLPTIYSSKSITQIDIYGDGNCFDQLQSFIVSHQMADKVNLCGWAKDFTETITQNQYMLVLGMGRVVLEAIKSSIPVGVLGYGGFAGLVNNGNLLEFSKNNLTSWNETPIDLSLELKKLFRNPKKYYFKSGQLSIFNIEIIWQKYYDVIQSLTYKKNIAVQTVYNWLSEHPSANILNDSDLFLTCVRLLSDGDHPISPQLFYNIFQRQFDQIHNLSTNISSLELALQKKKTSFSKLIYPHIKRVKKHD